MKRLERKESLTLRGKELFDADKSYAFDCSIQTSNIMTNSNVARNFFYNYVKDKLASDGVC